MFGNRITPRYYYIFLQFAFAFAHSTHKLISYKYHMYFSFALPSLSDGPYFTRLRFDAFAHVFAYVYSFARVRMRSLFVRTHRIHMKFVAGAHNCDGQWATAHQHCCRTQSDQRPEIKSHFILEQRRAQHVAHAGAANIHRNIAQCSRRRFAVTNAAFGWREFDY